MSTATIGFGRPAGVTFVNHYDSTVLKENDGASRKVPSMKVVDGGEWISIRGMRHFEQWIQRGVDLRTVQKLLGHSCITTTMQYAHFAPSHATRILEAQQSEQQELIAGGNKRATQTVVEETNQAFLQPLNINARDGGRTRTPLAGIRILSLN